MKIPLLNIDGTKSESIDVSDKIVKLKVNHKLIKYVIDWQLNLSKPRLAKTKQRNKIKGSTKIKEILVNLLLKKLKQLRGLLTKVATMPQDV